MNSTQNLEIKEFFTPGKTLEKAHVILHLAEPSAPHEKERGYLFILIELTNGSSQLIETSQNIIQYLENRYYSRDEKTEYLLERSLQSVNREYEKILTEHSQEITCLVGTIMDGAINLSYHGNPEAAVFYWQNNQLHTYKIIEGPADETVFFSDLVAGTINSRDFFYVATPHVKDYFPLDRIVKLLSDRPVREVSNHIQKVLAEIGSDYSFGGLIAQLNKKNTPKPGLEKAGSAASLNHLVTSADRTAETLSPPLIKDVKTTLAKLRERTRLLPSTSGPFTRGSRRQWGQTPPESFLQLIGKTLVGAGQTLAVVGLASIKGIKNIALGSYNLLRNERSRLDQIHSWRSGLQNITRSVGSLPPISKAITLGLVVTTLLFVSTLSYRHFYQQSVAKKEKITNLISAIQDKKEAAEASLAYEDKAKATILLNEGLALVRILKETDPKHESLPTVESELQTVFKTLRGEREVTSELVTDLSVVNATSQPNHLTGYGATVLAFGPNDQNWYFINTNNQEVIARQHEAMNQLVAAAADPEGTAIALRSASGEVGILDTTTQTLTKKTISFPTNNPTLETMALYNETLYTIDGTNKKMYRHNATQSGFDQGTSWSKSGEGRLNGAVSMGIDGDVYVLKNNGEVRKWYRGDEQGFSLAPVEPALTSAQAMVVPNESNQLFILDSTNKRVLIFDKSGGFREQLVSQSWTNPTGLWLDKTAKTLFILNGQLVYKVAL